MQRAWALAAALSVACGAGEPPSPAAAYLDDAEALKRGRLLFTGTCGAYCHGLSPGARDAPYLFDCTWKHGESDAEIFRTIAEGIPETRMLAFGGKLPEGDADIWRIVAWLRTQSRCR